MDGGRDDGRADLGLLVASRKQLGESIRHGMVELREGLLLLANGVVSAAAAERRIVKGVVGRRHSGDVVDVGSVLADHSDSDVALAITEDAGDNEIEDAEDEGKDT